MFVLKPRLLASGVGRNTTVEPVASAGAETNNAGRGAVPPAGSRTDVVVRDQGEAPKAENILVFGRPTNGTKLAEMTISGKMYLLYLTALHLCKNEGCTNTVNISCKNWTAKRTKALLASVMAQRLARESAAGRKRILT